MKHRHPYFPNHPERIGALLNQLDAWQGTRWRHSGARPNKMRCGITGDCLFWVPLFKSIGALPEKLEITDYRLQEALGDEMATLRLKIMETRRADQIYKGEPARHLPIFQIGDVLIFKNGVSGAHCGLVVREAPLHFVHLTCNGLNEEPFHQAHHLAALSFVYRLLESEVQA